MALDCGEFVFIHIPRTAGKWTRFVLRPLYVQEVGGFHELPPEFLPDKFYFCWERDRNDWIASVERYLNRPDKWWRSITQVNDTWHMLRNQWLSSNKVAFRLWLTQVFLQRYYQPEVHVIPFEQHVDILSMIVGRDNVERLSIIKTT